MSDSLEIHSASDAGVMHVMLNRPSDGNTFDIDTANALADAIEQAAEGAETRVLLLTATGKLFCGGGDVRAMSTADDPSAYTHELASALHRGILRLAQSDLLFVCGVQGPAAGAGFSLVLNADYVVASDRASFTTAYLSLGVTPDGGGSYLLPQVVGSLRAKELMLTRRPLDAETAHAWGIVNEVVASDELDVRAREFASELAASPRRAAAATKQLLNASWVDGYAEHLAREADSIATLIATEESRARQAKFLGRTAAATS